MAVTPPDLPPFFTFGLSALETLVLRHGIQNALGNPRVHAELVADGFPLEEVALEPWASIETRLCHSVPLPSNAAPVPPPPRRENDRPSPLPPPLPRLARHVQRRLRLRLPAVHWGWLRVLVDVGLQLQEYLYEQGRPIKTKYGMSLIKTRAVQ